MIFPSLQEKLFSSHSRKSQPEEPLTDERAIQPPPPTPEASELSPSGAAMDASSGSSVALESSAPLQASASSEDSPVLEPSASPVSSASSDASPSIDSPTPPESSAPSDVSPSIDSPTPPESPALSDASPSIDSPTPSESPAPDRQAEKSSSHEDEDWDVDYEDTEEYDFEERPRRRLVPAEIIMILIAVCSFCLLIVAVVFSFPHFFPKDEDPQSLPGYHVDSHLPVPIETILEPTVEVTEPENPTIPPDPNPYTRFDFQYNRHNYLLLQNLASFPGVDVSAYQGDIDWQAVADSGIYFAFIRLGYRGYGSGKLVEDSYAKQNLAGAYNAGLKVGAYFFSQALNQQEVDEEIEFMLEVLGEQYLEMPIILDWEIPAPDARTSGVMDARTLTDLQLYFCGIMKEKGYQPMVYFNWNQSENLYYLSDMEEYPFWLAYYNDRMTYPWHVEFWQYSDHGTVPGISGPVDMNVYMPA